MIRLLGEESWRVLNDLRGRPVILAVNKTEGMQAGVVTADFHELGLGEPFPISSAHGDGVRGLIDDALDSLGIAEPEPEDLQSDPNRPMEVLLGKPPRMHRDVTRVEQEFSELNVTDADLAQCIAWVCNSPLSLVNHF